MRMIRDVVLHMAGDLPLLADIESLPTAGDSTLVCTNLRTVDRKKPVSVDHIDSVFIVPLLFIRFIEIPRDAIARSGLGGHAPGAVPRPPALGPGQERDPSSPDVAPEAQPLEDLEPDEELLRRIREA